jgi:hypothetical protein
VSGSIHPERAHVDHLVGERAQALEARVGAHDDVCIGRRLEQREHAAMRDAEREPIDRRTRAEPPAALPSIGDPRRFVSYLR